MTKPLAKSLHTVTVLVRVATLHLNRIGADDSPEIRARLAMSYALDTLGFNNLDDPYGLIGQAINQVVKQLNK